LIATLTLLLGCPSSPDYSDVKDDFDGHEPEELGDDDNDGWTTDAGDCDDDNADVNPGASEVCGNQVDDDCDEDVDEGCDTADSG